MTMNQFKVFTEGGVRQLFTSVGGNSFNPWVYVTTLPSIWHGNYA